MKYTVPEKILQERGYKFQKLYANNYKTYRKKIGGYDIWLWSKGKSIEINDWHQHTDSVIKFFKDNYNHPKYDEPTFLGSKREALKIQLNRETSQCQLFDIEEYANSFKENDNLDKWYEKYEDWQEIVLHKKKLDEVIKEIEYLSTYKKNTQS